MVLSGLLNLRSPCEPSGLDLFKSTALGAAQILNRFDRHRMAVISRDLREFRSLAIRSPAND
jgi:hypothetical protein